MFSDGQFYCMLCEMSMHDSGDMDAGLHSSKAIGFKSTVSVKLNKETGKMEGWDSLFAFVEENKTPDVNQLYDHSSVVDRLKTGTMTV